MWSSNEAYFLTALRNVPCGLRLWRNTWREWTIWETFWAEWDMALKSVLRSGVWECGLDSYRCSNGVVTDSSKHDNETLGVDKLRRFFFECARAQELCRMKLASSRDCLYKHWSRGWAERLPLTRVLPNDLVQEGTRSRLHIRKVYEIKCMFYCIFFFFHYTM
jgi:hypothetical protein